MCDSEVDSHAFSIMGRVRTDPVHVHFPGNLQQMHIWFSRSVSSVTKIQIKLMDKIKDVQLLICHGILYIIRAAC